MSADSGHPPPQSGFVGDMAVGKSSRVVAAARQGLRIAYFAPGHVQTAEIVARIGPEIAHQWLGSAQPDPEMAQPDGAGEQILMCRRSAALDRIITAGGTLDDLCGSKSAGYCPFYETCGIRRQRRLAASGKITTWAFAHASLAHGMPQVQKRQGFDLVVIDEAPWLSMLGGFDDRPSELNVAFLAVDWSTGEYALKPTDREREAGADTRAAEHVSRVCALVHEVVANQGTGRLRRSSFRAPVGGREALTARDCDQARYLVWRAQRKLADVVEPRSGAIADNAFERVRAINDQVARLLKFFELLALLLKGPDEVSPHLTIFDRPAGRSIRMRWRQEIHDDWLALPIMYLDATMNEAVARQWLQRLAIVEPAMPMAVPRGVRIRQVHDAAVGHRGISPDPKASQKDRKTQQNNAMRIARRLENMAWAARGQGQGAADIAAIMPKGTEAAVSKQLPASDRVVLGHFNNVRGLNSMEGVRYLAIIGRTLPAPAEVEERAWVIFGRVGRAIDGWYPRRATVREMRDGSGREADQIYHPDPAAEAVRWLMCEAELIQAVTRGRHAWRDESKPLLIDIVTNVPLPLPVDELLTWDGWLDEAGPLAVMMARGIAPTDMQGRQRVLADWFPSAGALRSWLGRNPDAAQRIADFEGRERQGATLCQTPIRRSRGHFLWEFDTKSEWITVRYRRHDDRQGSTLLARTDLSDARAVAERYIGPLDVWELIKDQGRPPAA